MTPFVYVPTEIVGTPLRVCQIFDELADQKRGTHPERRERTLRPPSCDGVNSVEGCTRQLS